MSRNDDKEFYLEKRNVSSKLDTNNFWSFINTILIIIIIILVIIFCLAHTIDQCILVKTRDTTLCPDCGTCKLGYSINGDTCITENKMNGELCGPESLCFNHSLCDPTCDSGKCTGGDPECCSGFCNVDDDCPDILTVIPDEGPPTISKQCITEFNACQYQIITTNTDECLELIQNPLMRECLVASYTIGFFLDGNCKYNFRCAPILFGGALIPP